MGCLLKGDMNGSLFQRGGGAPWPLHPPILIPPLRLVLGSERSAPIVPHLLPLPAWRPGHPSPSRVEAGQQPNPVLPSAPTSSHFSSASLPGVSRAWRPSATGRWPPTPSSRTRVAGSREPHPGVAARSTVRQERRPRLPWGISGFLLWLSHNALQPSGLQPGRHLLCSRLQTRTIPDNCLAASLDDSAPLQPSVVRSRRDPTLPTTRQKV